MNDDELLKLFRDVESDRVERKESLSDPSKAYQAICAFANDLPNHQQPGVLFYGIKDDGTCTNTVINDKLLLELAQMRDNGRILPIPSLTVQKKVLDGCEVAVVIVEPSDAPPVRYDGRVWVRVGPRRAMATPQEERRLSEKRRSRDLPFDASLVRGATLDDLDRSVFHEYLTAALDPDVLAENQRTYEERLASLRFASLDGVPTITGILVCGIDPRAFLPGAYVQFIRFDGAELDAPIINQMEFSGPLSQCLRNLNTALATNITTSLSITQEATDTRYPDYPVKALQQLVYNAVMHRAYEGTNAPVRINWFTDRVEILSPGGPYGLVTIENFGQPGITDYRNPSIAEAMKNVGFIQRFGVGIQVARRALEQNGNPPLEFNIQPTHVLATLRRRS